MGAIQSRLTNDTQNIWGFLGRRVCRSCCPTLLLLVGITVAHAADELAAHAVHPVAGGGCRSHQHDVLGQPEQPLAPLEPQVGAIPEPPDGGADRHQGDEGVCPGGPGAEPLCECQRRAASGRRRRRISIGTRSSAR